MYVRFCETVRKDELFPNEDAFYPCEHGPTDRVVLSDGASESYASSKWANLLVENFVSPSGDSTESNRVVTCCPKIVTQENVPCGFLRRLCQRTRHIQPRWFSLHLDRWSGTVHRFSPDAGLQCPLPAPVAHSERSIIHAPNNNLWLENACKAYNDACSCQQMSWSQQAAFERGSFATLLALTQKEGRIRIFGVGDTCAIWLEDGEFRDSVPYKCSNEFEQRPKLISTIPSHNEFLRSGDFLESPVAEWQITRNTIILCMTDALAAWALWRKEANAPVWEQLCKISDQEAFENLVKDARKTREMRLDDSTLLRIDFKDGAGDGVSDP